MQEPGLDQHEWVSRWESLQPDLEDAPAEALPEIGRLVDEMLAERKYQPGADPELDRELATAREVTERLDDAEDVDPGDIGAAVHAFRTVYDLLVAQVEPS